MNPERDLEEYITRELMGLLPKVQERLAQSDEISITQGMDIYVSAVTGHLFTVLLMGVGQGMPALDRSPEAVGRALQTVGQKLSQIAQAVDKTADYRIQIFRRESGN